MGNGDIPIWVKYSWRDIKQYTSNQSIISVIQISWLLFRKSVCISLKKIQCKITNTFVWWVNYKRAQVFGICRKILQMSLPCQFKIVFQCKTDLSLFLQYIGEELKLLYWSSINDCYFIHIACFYNLPAGKTLRETKWVLN